MKVGEKCNEALGSGNGRLRYIPAFQDIIRKFEATYPSDQRLRPDLIYSNRYMSHILASEINDPPLLRQSIDAAIAVLRCIGLHVVDTAPTPTLDSAPPLTIDFAQSYLHYAYIAENLLHSIIKSLGR